jgi:hypothetical protein
MERNPKEERDTILATGRGGVAGSLETMRRRSADSTNALPRRRNASVSGGSSAMIRREGQTNSLRTAQTAAWVRSETPILRRMCCTCSFTVS